MRRRVAGIVSSSSTLLTLWVPAWPLRAQTPDSVTRAAATITPTVVAQSLAQLAADSLRPRPTPSAALERAAQAVAQSFQRLGLTPAAWEDLSGQRQSTFLQRYPVPGQRRVDPAASSFTIIIRAKSAADTADPELIPLSLATTAYFTPEVGPQQILSRKRFNAFTADPLSVGKPVAVVAGRQTLQSVQRAAKALRDKAVLYVPAAGVDSALRRQLITALYTLSQGVLVVSAEDSASFAASHVAHQQPVAMVDDYLRATAVANTAASPLAGVWALTVWAEAVRPFLTVAGLDLAQLQADTTPLVRTLPSTAAFLGPDPAPSTTLATAPNVVGVLEGSDPKLKDEYLVVAAHLDTPPTTPDRASSAPAAGTPPGTDNAAGVAALLAVAQAFTQPGLRPRRSVLFLATSGGAQAESWGASAFAYSVTGFSGHLGLIADLTLDRLSQATGDSIWIDGLRDVELAMAPAWVVGAHPELGILVADGGTAARPGSDQFPFVQASVPSLYVHTAPADGPRAGPPAPGVVPDATHVARVAQYVFYLAQAIAAADRVPRWSTEGHQHLAAVLDP